MPTPVGRQYGALPTSGPTRRPRRALPGPAPEAPRAMRPELMLAVAIAAEIVATTSLKLTEGFTKPFATLLVLALAVVSIFFVTKASESIPLGTAYAAWGGIGALGTVVVGIFFFNEPVTLWRMVFLSLLIMSIIGLKLVTD